MSSFKRFIPFILLGVVFSCSSPDSKRVILTVGDSNGAAEYGWVYQLQQLRPDDVIINTAISGNTIGFDNNGHEYLNSLKRIGRYIEIAADSVQRVDEMVILLGTNDCKSVFRGRENEALQNLAQLIGDAQQLLTERNLETSLTLVTPPPFSPDSLLSDKYKGGDACAAYLAEQMAFLAEEQEVRFVNIYSSLKPDFSTLNTDGVHLTAEGHKRVAEQINEALRIP
ncbi:MAG: GDSL-type esterase/lipase family protein [Bacteroidota bacterium]